jgi:predicted helicase
MYARIVAKVGERRYWETWAKDIADIAAAHVTRIKGLLASPGPAADEFAHFVAGLRGNLNDSITDDAAIDMLAQHLITRPVFEALFAHSSFLAGNPVARTMENMLAVSTPTLSAPKTRPSRVSTTPSASGSPEWTTRPESSACWSSSTAAPRRCRCR